MVTSKPVRASSWRIERRVVGRYIQEDRVNSMAHCSFITHQRVTNPLLVAVFVVALPLAVVEMGGSRLVRVVLVLLVLVSGYGRENVFLLRRRFLLLAVVVCCC